MMVSWLRIVTRRWRNRVGHRGTFLLFFALLNLVISVSFFAPGETAKSNALLIYASQAIPLSAWGFLWLMCGVIPLVQAFQKQDKIAFFVVVGINTLWGLVSLLGWLFGNFERGYVNAVIFIAFAGLAYATSSWRENES